MRIKLVAATAIILLSMAATQARAAAATWTLTATGHIMEGRDETGVFGMAGQNLAGLSFTQSITASIDPALWSEHDYTPSMRTLQGSGPTFMTSATVGNTRVSYSPVTTISGMQSVQNGISLAQGYEAVDSIQYGLTAESALVFAFIEVASDTQPVINTLSFSQNFSLDLSDGDFRGYAEFSVDGANFAIFTGRIEHLTVASVPEPENYAMLLAGLGILGFATRRKRTAA